MSVLVETSFGDIVIDLYVRRCPNACMNFIKLCKMKHYNNALFAEVQKDYVTKVRTKKPTTIWHQAQGSNHQDSLFFKDQLDLELRMNLLGLVSTANQGANLNNSDFFITLTKAHLASLNGKHTVFGKVEEGFDILKKISEIDTDRSYRPQMNVRILHTYILEDPFEEQFSRMTIPDSPRPEVDSDRLQALEHFEMLAKNRTEGEIMEVIKESKANKQKQTLVIAEDLPDADIKPPENILFICKLNMITMERDLEIIFSRFGPIKSVEIVRDWKTGQSLQYGFVEFESPNACEEAYLKMENVVIDDRRIHVDFSQSVSKLVPKKIVKDFKERKNGEMKEKMKELVPKGREDKKERYGDRNFEYVINAPQGKQDTRIERFRKEQVDSFIEKREKLLIEEDSRQKKRQRSRSRSRSRDKHRERSKQRKHNKEKTKRKKRERSSSSSSSESSGRNRKRKSKKRRHSRERY